MEVINFSFLSEENQHIRTTILDTLARVYEESTSSFADIHIQTLSKKTGLDVQRLISNLQVLEKAGYIEGTVTGSSQITYDGLEAVAEWKQRSGLADEFEQIAKMKPQPRGLAFQKLFAKVVEKYGWSQEESVRTPHEEMDVIVYKEREYYLVECKWEKSPIEARIVRELYGKLGNRIGVLGMVVSMSGFASGAIEQAEQYANEKVILFFGPQDVHSLVHETSSFEKLLNEKYQQLITRRKIIFD